RRAGRRSGARDRPRAGPADRAQPRGDAEGLRGRGPRHAGGAHRASARAGRLPPGPAVPAGAGQCHGRRRPVLASRAPRAEPGAALRGGAPPRAPAHADDGAPRGGPLLHGGVGAGAPPPGRRRRRARARPGCAGHARALPRSAARRSRRERLADRPRRLSRRGDGLAQRPGRRGLRGRGRHPDRGPARRALRQRLGVPPRARRVRHTRHHHCHGESVPMTEKPLDRLNYFNGQRLEASDLKTEQEYHIRVRRWLNKSLYSPGIARGLEVRKETAVPVAGEKPPPTVVVSPGLALDAQGREITLWEEQRVMISSEARPSPGNTEAEVEGLYLTIRYSEEVTAVEQDGCDAVSGTTRGGHPAWGGPTRVRARAIFEQRDFLPPESSGEVVLALVELNGDCSEVHQIDVGVRRYVGAASAAKVRQYALEGARDIDWKNPARIYFHIRGRQPQAVTLYLRSEILSTMYYTELGRHKHDLEIAYEDHHLPAHRHSVGGLLTTAGEGNHGHSMLGNMSDFGPPQILDPPPRYDAFVFGYRPGNPNGNQQQQEIWARHTETEFSTHLNIGLSFRGGEH